MHINELSPKNFCNDGEQDAANQVLTLSEWVEAIFGKRIEVEDLVWALSGADCDQVGSSRKIALSPEKQWAIWLEVVAFAMDTDNAQQSVF